MAQRSRMLPIAMATLMAGATLAAAASGGREAPAAAGEQVFASSGCAYCHGDKLAGSDKAPGLLDVGRRLKPEAIRTQITAGGKGMPAFAGVLSEGQVQQLVDYLRRQRNRSAATAKWGAAPSPTP